MAAETARRRHAPALPWAGSLARWKGRQGSQGGTGNLERPGPCIRQKRGTGHAGIHWNGRQPVLRSRHSLPPRCERPSTGPRRARTGRGPGVRRSARPARPRRSPRRADRVSPRFCICGATQQSAVGRRWRSAQCGFRLPAIARSAVAALSQCARSGAARRARPVAATAASHMECSSVRESSRAHPRHSTPSPLGGQRAARGAAVRTAPCRGDDRAGSPSSAELAL